MFIFIHILKIAVFFIMFYIVYLSATNNVCVLGN